MQTRKEPVRTPPDAGNRSRPLRIAAVVTTFFPNSHAGVIVDKFLRGFPTDEGVIPPRSTIVSLYIDQIHERDVGRQIAYEFDIPLYESIRAALTLGGDELAVDAVLLIGEHGDYPRSELGQEMLPRRYFFEQIAGVIGEAGRPIPVFNDKHLSYRWDDAAWMYETAKAKKIPLWAASALPVVWRNPNWEHPLGQPVDRALVIGFHMVERYGFHALEVLQSNVERRRGGETGVRSVQCLSGDEVWRAGEGRWSIVANEALSRIEDGPGSLDPARSMASPLPRGIRRRLAAVLMLGDGYVRKFAYAQQRGHRPTRLSTTSPRVPPGRIRLSRSQHRGLLRLGSRSQPRGTNPSDHGILEAAMISRSRGGQKVQTPHLSSIRYQPGKGARRPSGTRPKGASVGDWIVHEPGATPAAQPIPIKRDGTVRRPRPTN